jgi:filamentous hemagglutinin
MPSHRAAPPHSMHVPRFNRGSSVRVVGATAALLGPLAVLSVSIAGTLPVPCATGACGVTGPQTWVTSGSAHLVQVGNLMTITQLSENAVLNWQSFNVSSDGTVTFKQPDAGAVALNQIFQADPSKILGALNANGSIYLINQNGIIFGAGAQVNTGSLIASSLNITPAALSGILNAGLNNSPAFASFVDANGNPLVSGPVQVASSATIKAPGGEIMLFGSKVTNQGSLAANGGQVILAAGDSVYLAASTDPNLRGLLVEVGHGGTVTNSAASSPGGSDYGQISAGDGNVSMVGLMVNQLGRVSATTAVQQNGSIYLLAQDGGSVTAQAGATVATLNPPTNAGTLTLGAGSHTDITLDLASTGTAVDATAQPKSQVMLGGQTVTLAGGSEITATAGNVAITAAAQPGESPDKFSSQPGTGRLVVDAGASIDVSGANIALPMSSNVIAVQLRGTELANSPEQRTGPLYGQTVYVDTRQSGVLNGTAWVGSPIGDLSGYVAAVQRTVSERNLTGGTITLNSDGAVFVASQATLNISGGSINYLPGYINTTKLLGTNGQVYDISQANPNQSYVGIVSNYSLTDPKWGVTQTYPGIGSADPRGQFEEGYVEGKDAGALTIVAPRVVLDGNVTASTVIGPFQRQLAATLDSTTNPNLFRPVNQMPLSGQLTLGLADGGGAGNDNYLLPNVVFAAGTVLNTLTGPTGAPFNPLTDPLPAALNTVQIRPDLFGPNGIGRLDLYTNGTVSLPANIALQLPIAGQLLIRAGAIDFAGSVTAHDGSVALSAATTELIQAGGESSALTLGGHSAIDVSGEWINDQPIPNAPAGTAPLAIGGGNVKISATGGTPLDLQAGSLIDVSGGAQRSVQGKITGGAAGTVTIGVGPSNTGAAVPVTVASTLEGYGLTQGGALSLSANAICIAAADCANGQSGLLWVPTRLFSADGFARLSLSSNFGGLDVEAGTQITPQQLNFVLLDDSANAPSGTPFSSLAAPDLLPDLFRAPVSVSLNVSVTPPPAFADFDNATFAAAGILTIGHGASIALDPTASLSLSTNTSIVIDGSLSAPAGSLSIATTTSLPISEFLNTQGIWLQGGAQLSTQGVAQLQVNDLGQRTGSVLNGGNISIAANRGYLITAPGSSIDASGTAAEVNLAQNVSIGSVISAAPTLIGSNGGTVTLAAAEGMLLNGAVAAHAGNAPGAAGGSLDITLDGNLHGGEPNPGGTPIFPFSPRQIILTNGAPVIVKPQYSIPDQYNGVALVPTGMIEAGGFSALQLTAKNLFDANGPAGQSAPVSTASILFAQDTNLQLPASIRLDAPQISTTTGAQVQLQAAYVGLGYDDAQGGAQTGYSTSAGPGTSNSGSLQVHANLIDFIGSLGLGGFSSSAFDSSGDIRFIGVESGGPTPLPIAGTLVAQGSLVLQADQLYPTTLTQFDVSVSGAPNGAPNTLAILAGSSSGDAVLSAGGQLTLQADTIQQSGILRAPFGQLILDAAQITLAPGSITSTSGAGQTIPFGSTQAGTDWVYGLPQGQFAVYTQSGPPAKSVQLNGNSIIVAKGAAIDLSGGGDLQASEFVPGVGGTVDVLSNTNSQSPGQFAIVPELSLQYAPYDPQSQTGFSYAPGSSVVLAGGGGVAAGTYAILPASYALLPGAYLVRPVTGFTDIAPGQSIGQLDGSTIIAGQFAVAGTNIIADRTAGFDIRPGTAVQSLAQYTLTSADAFFSQLAKTSGATAPSLPMDAGQLQFSAAQQLEFLGDLVVSAAPGGRGAEVDISANQIDITNGGAVTAAAGTVVLEAAQLNALGAQSLLIGGTRSSNGDVTQVETSASTLTVDPGVTLSGNEIMLTASTNLTLSQGATLNANGATVTVPSEYDLAGNGAFLRVSTGAQTSIARTNPNLDATLGALTIGVGATIKGSGSASLEASGNFQSQATYELAGGSLSFTASQISLGTAPGGTAGLVLSPAQLSTLNLSALDLTSGSSISIFGGNTLSVSGNLTLNSAAIAAATGDAAALLQAKQITLEGGTAALSNGSVASGITPPSSGSLTLQADQLILGGGVTEFTGFKSVALNGAADIRAGAAGSITSDAPLTLHTELLGTADGVNFEISSPNNSLQVLGAIAPTHSASAAPGAGGSVYLSGTDVAIDTAVTLPSGVLQLAATGPAATDNVVIGAAASIDVSGISINFDSVAVAGPGGRVSMNATAGSVTMASGARIDLSAANSSGAAGVLSIAAPNGTADLQGTLTATGGSDASAGQFTLDLLQLPDLANLNATLNAGGFGGVRSFTQRGVGDVILSAAGRVRAATVSISNDGGSVDILGSIDASGAAGGSVNLSAQNAVNIAGAIDAAGSGSGQSGGSLDLVSTSGVVHIDNTAIIDLAGAPGVSNGSLSLTVPRASLTGLLTAGAGSPAAISLGGSIQGTQQVQVEGLATYNAANDAIANTISAADIAPSAIWYTDATTFMNHAVAIGAALKGTSTLNVSVVPGIQIQSAGDLTLGTDWDLSTWRFNGAPGILTLRAGGNLLIQQSLSDGFDGIAGAGAFVLPSIADHSWSYRLIAGANLGASDLMAVESPGSLASGTGNVELAAGVIEAGRQKTPVPVMVRTGTGYIDVAAAGDLQFGNRASVIYTAGQNSGSGIPLPELADLAYPTAGGNIDVNVGGNIIGAPTNQLVTSWLWRAGQPPAIGSAASATGWTVNYQWFEENIGALAGGDVAVSAGGNISELSVAVPTIGVQVGGSDFAQNVIQVTGGGNLKVQSGGNITGGSYFVGQGSGMLEAGNSVGADLSGAANATGLAPILALGDASINIIARSGITIESVLNPFLLPQATVQGANQRAQSFFSTYTDASAVSLVTTAGDVTLLNQPAIDGVPTQLNSMRFASSQEDEALTLYPGTVNAAALTGNLNIEGAVTLWPSPTGNLNLLAGHDVLFAPQQGSVLMSGLDPGSLASPGAPVQLENLISQLSELFAPPTPGASQTPIHSAAFTPNGQNDSNPARIVALNGSIIDGSLSYIPKPVHVIAGQDITELTLNAENIVATDISIISAGRDISYASPRDVNGILTPESQSIVIQGPGSLLIEAGRNINLGTSTGITTVGNLDNPAIAAGGASASVLTGATVGNADLTDFIARYLTNSTTYDSLLINYVQARSAAPVTTKADALSIFDALPLEQQFLLCQQILYDEIRTGGRAAAAAGPHHGDYSRSFLALSTLFPNSTTAKGPNAATSAYPGSLSLYFSQIYTLDGGDISLLTPGGSVNVGLSTPPLAFGITKTPSELGIVAQGVGNINSVSYGNFLVNQSRVFASDGGDILVWSTDGNVDAGRGAKTAISAPAPTITINAQGQIQTTFPAALEGSGIQALATTAGVTPGDVDLYAPQGVVNASDAGIVAGNLTIGATAVLGRNNITVSGVSVGVPVDASGLGASLAGASSVSSSAANAATVTADAGNKTAAATPLAQSALGFLDVFVIGLGEDTCNQADIECLKRQRVN